MDRRIHFAISVAFILLLIVAWLVTGIDRRPGVRVSPSLSSRTGAAEPDAVTTPEVAAQRDPMEPHEPSSAATTPGAADRGPVLDPLHLFEGMVRVHGHVYRSAAPVADHDLSFHAMGAGVDDLPTWATSQEGGRFELLLRPGRYLVRDGDDGPWLGNVTVPCQREFAVDVDLPRGMIRGQVVHAETQVPAANVRVVALRSTVATESLDVISQALMAWGGEVRCRPDGSFVLSGLHPGDYRLLAGRDGIWNAPVGVTVDREPGEEVLLEVRSEPTLHGVVEDTDGWPAAMDLWVCHGSRLDSLTALLAATRAVTGRDGLVRLAGLPPGPYVVFGAGDKDTHDLALHAAVDWQPGSPPLRLTAQVCGFLSVTVTRPDGRPVPNACLDLRAPDGALVLASREWWEDSPGADQWGQVELDDVLPGRYRIAACWAGRRGPAQEVDVGPWKTTVVRLLFE